MLPRYRAHTAGPAAPTEIFRFTDMNNKAELAFDLESSARCPSAVAAPLEHRPSPSESSDPGLRSRIGPTVARALTILLSSFLLFLVQPILAKQVLPWFGGTAGCGRSARCSFRSCCSLATATRTGSGDLLRRAARLSTCRYCSQAVGLPYLLLASTSPLLQSWSTDSLDPRQRQSIYRLFALSSLGSLPGLLRSLCQSARTRHPNGKPTYRTGSWRSNGRGFPRHWTEDVDLESWHTQ
jgi:hypothetical protein